MPARVNETVYRSLLVCTAKVGGKQHRWNVAVFPNDKALLAFAGMLKLNHKIGDIAAVTGMDPNGARIFKEELPTDVKLTADVVPYAPQPPALDDAAALG